jgi:amidase
LFEATQRRDGPMLPLSDLRALDRPRLRVGLVVNNFYGARPDPDVEATCLAAGGLLQSLGHEVSEAAWPFDGEAFIDSFMCVWSSGAAGVAAFYKSQAGQWPDESVLEPWTLGMAEEFLNRPEGALEKALGHFSVVSRDFERAFADFDVLLSPVVRKPGVRIGELSTTRPYADLRRDVLDFASYTPAHNAAGIPAMSVPFGVSSEGLPIGIQVSAPFAREDRLFALAYELEEVRPWRSRLPAQV